MTRNPVQLILGVLLVAGLLCRAAAAQEAPSDAKGKEAANDNASTRITLGSGSGTPGDAVVVPLYFAPAQGVSVGHLKIEVTFVSVNLKFDKIDRGIAAEMGDVKLTSDAKTGKNDKGLETTTLSLDAAEDSPKKPIPAGLLGYITMKISETGRPANIALHAKIEGTESGSDRPLKNVKAIDAEVEVLAPGTQPAVSCFFFSH